MKLIPALTSFMISLKFPSHFFTAECEIGSYEKNGKCIPCPRDNYQNNTGQTVCFACDKGDMTITNGATSKSLCVDRSKLYNYVYHSLLTNF